MTVLLAPLGIHLANTQIGVFIALTFIGLPFIVRTVQPILDDLDPELEEAASSLGANRWQVFWRVTIDGHWPADVAADLNLSTSAVYKAKSRVLTRLRDELAGLL